MFKRAVQQALAAAYHRILCATVSRYSASILEVPGVFGGGDDIEEANRTLEEALADWVDVKSTPAIQSRADRPGRLQAGGSNCASHRSLHHQAGYARCHRGDQP